MRTQNAEKKLYAWTWDPILVCYHNVVVQCYRNIENIYSSLWAKIFKSLAQKKLDAEMKTMNWANGQIEARVKELETTYNDVKVCRFNSLTGEWLS